MKPIKKEKLCLIQIVANPKFLQDVEKKTTKIQKPK